MGEQQNMFSTFVPSVGCSFGLDVFQMPAERKADGL
jgi:hypothetical protein